MSAAAWRVQPLAKSPMSFQAPKRPNAEFKASSRTNGALVFGNRRNQAPAIQAQKGPLLISSPVSS